MKKLTRSKERILFGVVGGLAEYFEIDATLLRVGYILVMLITAVIPMIVFYIICIFIIPDPYRKNRTSADSGNQSNTQNYHQSMSQNSSTELEVQPEQLTSSDEMHN